jgi:hypothetical protein
MRGKAVWSAFPLPGPWPDPELTAPPRTAARYLAATLAARGVEDISHHHDQGVSLVTVPLSGPACVNVWVEPGGFTFTDTDGTRVHRPLMDAQDLAEHLVRRIEEDRCRHRPRADTDVKR